MKLLKAFWNDTAGATALEYAFVASMVSVAIIGTLTALFGSLNGLYTKIKDAVPS